jgi:hypothetical protein
MDSLNLDRAKPQYFPGSAVQLVQGSSCSIELGANACSRHQIYTVIYTKIQHNVDTGKPFVNSRWITRFSPGTQT